MKIMKKALALVLTLALVLSLFTRLTLTAHADEPLYWLDELEDGTVRLSYLPEGCAGLTTLNVPAEVNGKRVTILDVPPYLSSLQSVTIPKGILSIADSAFVGCENLQSVRLPEGLVSIGANAFSECPNLESITIPASMNQLGTNAFFNSGLRSFTVSPSNRVYASSDGVLFSKDMKTLIAYPANKPDIQYQIPDSVTALCEFAFSNSRNLSKVIASDALTAIPTGAFIGSSLAQIILPAKLTSISASAFERCEKLTALRIPDGVTSLGNAMLFECTSLKELVLPAGLTRIPDLFATGCTALEKVEIPASVTSIGEQAFCSCLALREYSIPDSVTQIGSLAFSDCVGQAGIRLSKNLKTLGADALGNCRYIEVDEENPNFCAVDGVLFSKDRSVLVRYPSDAGSVSYTIPSGVTELAPAAFEDTRNLTHVTIPDTVTKLGDGVFQNSGLLDVSVPAGVTVIPDGAFFCCTELTDIDFLGEITEIGESALSICGFSELTLPDSVTAIGYYGLGYCENLKELHLPAQLKDLGPGALSGCSQLTSVELPYGLTTIDYATFSYCTGLSELTIPATVRSIDIYDFEECPSLKTINYGGTKRSWETLRGDYSIDGLDNRSDILQNVTIRYNGTDVSDENFLCVCEKDRSELILYALTDKAKNAATQTVPAAINTLPIRQIGAYAFADCPELYTVRLPEGIDSIGRYAFTRCNSLGRVELPSTLRRIEKGAFSFCASLGGITLPDGLTELGACAFQFCDWLESIRIPDGIRVIRSETFAYCDSLRDVVLPETLEQIEDSAFVMCSMPMISLPDRIESIGSCAFSCCYALSELQLPEDLRDLGPQAFGDCTGLRELRLPENLQMLGSYAFMNCGSLKWVYIPDSVTQIGYDVFEGSDSLKDVFYEGSEAQWSGIDINPQNRRLDHTGIHYSSVPAVGDFYDVREIDWFCDSVAYAYEEGLMNGTGDYVFSPNDPLTRAQLVTILYRMEGSPEVSFRGTFPDVAPGTWYSDAIEWAAANGIVNGYTDGTFGPNDEITREQIATILYRLDGSPEATGELSFPDASAVGGYAVDAMRWAVSEGLINGVSSGGMTSLAPKNTATRAQIAAIIMRYRKGEA